MKKLLIVLLFIVVAFGVYKLFKTPSADFNQLEYVPADTPIFSAQLEPIDLQSYMASLGIFPGQIEQFKTLMSESTGKSQAPAAVFLMQFLDDYLDALSTPEEFTKKTGFKNELRSLFYMVGISPVLQVELSDPATFLAMFARAQQRSGITHSEETIDGNLYHRYVLDAAQEAELLVRINNGWGVVTLHHSNFDEQHLTTSLAITKPAKSLLDSDVIEKMQDEYNLGSAALGFVSSEQLALAFTTLDGNSFARDLNFVMGDKIAADLATVRSPECKSDIEMLTAIWPGLFMGTDVEINDSGDMTINSRSLIPTTSQTTIDSLKAMRGFLPSYATGDLSTSVFKMGVGTDVANLSRSVNRLWTAMVNLDLSCAALVELQDQIKLKNPTGAFAMAGMANGFMGIAASVNKIDLAGMQEGNMDVDAIISVAAEDVRTLFASVQTFSPMLGAITLPKDGEELIINEVFPMLDQFGITVTAMASEGQLILFSGNIAHKQATQTLTETPVKNGLMAFGMDYKAFFEQLMPLMAMSGQAIPAELESMMNTNMAISVTTDITDAGIEVKADMLIKK